uniref:Uncharacterized protein n=1 Tax=Solanum lycopersicum TaxID=4081 RepID=A0A3Q7HT30_SOLLC
MDDISLEITLNSRPWERTKDENKKDFEESHGCKYKNRTITQEAPLFMILDNCPLIRYHEPELESR